MKRIECHNCRYVLAEPLELLGYSRIRECPICKSGMRAWQDAVGDRGWKCDNSACGFTYPIWWDADEILLIRHVRRRLAFLESVREERKDMIQDVYDPVQGSLEACLACGGVMQTYKSMDNYQKILDCAGCGFQCPADVSVEERRALAEEYKRQPTGT